MSWLLESVGFKLRIRRLSYIYPLSKSSAPPVSKLRSVGELGSSKTTGSLSLLYLSLHATLQVTTKEELCRYWVQILASLDLGLVLGLDHQDQ